MSHKYSVIISNNIRSESIVIGDTFTVSNKLIISNNRVNTGIVAVSNNIYTHMVKAELDVPVITQTCFLSRRWFG